MADHALIKIMTALLKHQVKKLVGEDALGVIGQELTAIGGDKFDKEFKSLLGEKTATAKLEKAARDARDIFRGKVNDDEVEEWMAMLPLHDLPAVVSALEELPTSPDEAKLEKALRESISLNWKRLSAKQVDNAVNEFLISLRSALLPLEKHTLMVIGRSVLRTEEKVNQLIHLFDQYIINNPPKPSKQLLATAPSPFPHFVGREKILTKVKSILVNKTHFDIIAITGMGGAGKTSLALQIISDVKDKFRNNVFWGDLSKFEGDAVPILREWAEKYCGHELPARVSGEELAGQVRALLTERQENMGPMLIVVDDLRDAWLESGEILLSAAPANAPVIITTREMDVAQVLKATKVFNLDEYLLSDSEAIKILVAVSENKINIPQSKIIAGLCEKMPLALELAAQIAKAEGAKYLLEKLGDAAKRLESLKVGSRDRKDSSIKMTFKISYDSLSANSALTFRYLGAFAPVDITDFHLSKVFNYSLNKIDADEELRLLRRYSLLQPMQSSDEKNTSYRMHALLHTYAESLLKKQQAEATQARQGHFACFHEHIKGYVRLDLTNRTDGKVQDFETYYPQMMRALTNFEQEYSPKNSKLKNTQLQSAVELIDILDKYWTLHDYFDIQANWLEIAYNISGKSKLPLKQADFARRVGRIKGWQGELKDGFKWMKRCETALGTRKEKAANTIRAQMHIHRASLKYQKGNFASAQKECLQGIRMITEKGEPRIYAEGYNLLGALKLIENKLAPALVAFQKSFSVWKKTGDQYQIARVEDNVRTAHYYLGEIAYLRKADEKGLQDWRKFPYSKEYAAALMNRGMVHYIDEKYDSAIDLHKQAMELSDSLGYMRLRAQTRVNLAEPYIKIGKYTEAENLLNKSLKLQKEHDLVEFETDTKRCLAELEIGRGNYTKAVKLARIAEKSSKEDGPLEQGSALRVLGQACLLDGNQKQSSAYLKKSLKLLQDNEYKYESYLTLQCLRYLYRDTGDVENERVAFKRVQLLAKKMGLK